MPNGIVSDCEVTAEAQRHGEEQSQGGRKRLPHQKDGFEDIRGTHARMVEIFTRVVENLFGRLHGPLTFRLILQPLAAAVIATRAGIDARKGCPVYGWTVLT